MAGLEEYIRQKPLTVARPAKSKRVVAEVLDAMEETEYNSKNRPPREKCH